MSLFRARGRTIRHASWFMSLHTDNCVWNWSGHTQFLSFPLCIWITTRDQMWCFQQFPWQRLHHRISSGTNFLLQSCKSISIKWNILLAHPRTVCYELGSVQAFLMFSLFKYHFMKAWRPKDSHHSENKLIFPHPVSFWINYQGGLPSVPKKTR